LHPPKLQSYRRTVGADLAVFLVTLLASSVAIPERRVAIDGEVVDIRPVHVACAQLEVERAELNGEGADDGASSEGVDPLDLFRSRGLDINDETPIAVQLKPATNGATVRATLRF